MGIEQISIFKKEMGITNKQLSELSGVPKSTIDKITSGLTKDPSLETVKALVSALGKSLNDIDDVENSKDGAVDGVAKSLFVKNIISYRKQNKLKQSELAEMLGKSLNTIIEWENNTKEVDVDSIKKMLAIFNIDANTFFGWDEHHPVAFGIEAETGEVIPQLEDNDVADILKDVMDLPKEALSELRYSIEFLKYKYKKG